MNRVISFVAGTAAFAVGFGVNPQLPQSIDHRPFHYLAPPAPDVAAPLAATIVGGSRQGDRLSRSASGHGAGRAERPTMSCEPEFGSQGDPSETNIAGRCLASEAKTKLAAAAD